MRIVTIGRGTIGGGLARLWAAAGHQVTTLGREGGDDGAGAVTEQLMGDAGCARVRVGALGGGGAFEDAVWLLRGVQPVGGVFSGFATPGRLWAPSAAPAGGPHPAPAHPPRGGPM